MRRAAPMGALWMLSSLMELFFLRLYLWQRQCNPIRYWQTQCNQAARQSECDSPLRGQSHSLCLLTAGGKSEFSPRTSGDFCYNTVSCRSAGRLVIILKGRHNAKTDCLGASSGRTMSISSPRRVSFRAYQSPLRYARGGVFIAVLACCR